MKSNLKRVGIIGAGAIAKLIVDACANGLVICDELIVYDFDPSAAEKLRAGTSFPLMLTASFEELIAKKPAVIIEAASQQAAKEYVPRIVQAGIELIVMSTGALLQLPSLNAKVHVTSGAIGGLDAIAAAKIAGINEVTLTTHKPPKALEMTNTESQLVYEGTAEEAAIKFPREMNVAATLALAVRPVKVRVRVIADPAVVRNAHEIHVNWRFGEMNFRFANDPHPDNPRTSALAAWSAIHLLQILLKT